MSFPNKNLYYRLLKHQLHNFNHPYLKHLNYWIFPKKLSFFETYKATECSRNKARKFPKKGNGVNKRVVNIHLYT